MNSKINKISVNLRHTKPPRFLRCLYIEVLIIKNIKDYEQLSCKLR